MNAKLHRWGWSAAVALLLLAGLAAAQWQRVSARVSPNAVLYLLADSQRELVRLPVAFTPLSDAEEVRIGNRLAQRYAWMTADKATNPQEVEVRRYVEQVGARLAAHAHRKLIYHFHYIPQPGFDDAFAIPGGHVYIGEGLLALMHNEDELAFVLGHEIEHIEHRHPAERLQTELALRKIPLGGLLVLPVEVFEAGYTKDEEFQADREGTRLAVAAGYSPEGAIQMLETFQKLEQQVLPVAQTSRGGPLEELSQVSIGILTGYFRSHPASADRIAAIRRLIAEERWNAKRPERPLAVAYIFLAARARNALLRADYKQAADLASRSLAQRPDQPAVLATLAKAEMGLGDFTPANTAYPQLVADHPAEADSIRAFADQLATMALEARLYAKAEALATESLALQPSGTPAMVELGEARLGSGDLAGAAQVVRQIQKQQMSPQAADQILSYAQMLANQATHQGRFAQAADYVSFRLEFLPGQPGLLASLAENEYSAANFAAAATAYGKLLDSEIAANRPSSYEYVKDFSNALAAARLGQQGVTLFQYFLALAGHRNEADALPFQIELAGLQLMAGNAAPADSMANRMANSPASFPPELFSRLGWWFYRAGNYGTAEKILKQAARIRPGDAKVENNLGWVELEQKEESDATQRFALAGRSTYWPLSPPSWNAPGIGRAIALWRLNRKDEALREFQPAIDKLSPWLNEQWVKAVFTPGVAETAAQLREAWKKQEAERRKFYPSRR